MKTNPNQRAEYPGVPFDSEHALVHYRVFNADRKRCDLVQARVPIHWFYAADGPA